MLKCLLVVAVECMFVWSWPADLCAQEDIPFVLGHALYMKAIHGGKTKNDKIDSKKIATLLRGGTLPVAYVYPRTMRSTRDLLRRRNHLMRKRSELLAHIQNTNSQCNKAKGHNSRTFYLLRSIPGVGKIVSLVLLYEIHTINRFPRVQDFVSYCRLVKCPRESGGKKSDSKTSKIGNAHLEWAFSEATCLFLRVQTRFLQT